MLKPNRESKTKISKSAQRISSQLSAHTTVKKNQNKKFHTYGSAKLLKTSQNYPLTKNILNQYENKKQLNDNLAAYRPNSSGKQLKKKPMKSSNNGLNSTISSIDKVDRTLSIFLSPKQMSKLNIQQRVALYEELKQNFTAHQIPKKQTKLKKCNLNYKKSLQAKLNYQTNKGEGTVQGRNDYKNIKTNEKVYNIKQKENITIQSKISIHEGSCLQQQYYDPQCNQQNESQYTDQGLKEEGYVKYNSYQSYKTGANSNADSYGRIK